jgi:hypothetical protein
LMITFQPNTMLNDVEPPVTLFPISIGLATKPRKYHSLVYDS